MKLTKFFNALVSRPVGRAELCSNPKAMESMKKEWQGLTDHGVFDLFAIREYFGVTREARQKNKDVRVARARGLVVEKHSQLEDEDSWTSVEEPSEESNPRSGFVPRPWQLTCHVRSIQTGFLGCFEGWGVRVADAVQAYIQAELRGAECWVELPPEAVPDELKEASR